MSFRLVREIPEYLQQGSTGIAVVILQAFLCGLDYGHELAFDGEYGAKTAEAVGRFQKAYNLEVDGNFGPATRRKAKQVFNFDFEAACKAMVNKPVNLFSLPSGEIVDFK